MTILVPRNRPSRLTARAPRLLRAPKPSPYPHDSHLFTEERLLCHAGVPPTALRRIRALAIGWGVSLRKAAIAAGYLHPRTYAKTLANVCGLKSLSGGVITLRPIMPAPEPYRLLKTRLPIPMQNGSTALLNADNFTPEQLRSLASALGPARQRVALIDGASLSRAITQAYGEAIAQEAASGLSERRPRFSAAFGMRRWQAVFLMLCAGLFAGGAIFTPREATAVYSAALSLMFLLTISMRLAAAAHACFRNAKGRPALQPRPRDYELPNYTVMVAMYKEARVLPELVEALKALHYPVAKLDIKLVLEAVDDETVAAARAIDLPPHFQIVTVPDGAPRTKPRALNYALHFATGDFLVIYDAEDRPEPDQLMKAAAHFRQAAPEVVCLQARLTFDNASENWLAKQFTIEYASLFGGILPMLDAARLPIPLGGTSNHFRIKALRGVGAWDAHNVTEDADLGIRLYRCGLRAEVLDSVTYEEACCQPWSWLKQRTRWLKGWIQTYGVHMRQPLRLARELGLGGFLAFQGHFAGVIVAALVHPLSYILIIHDAAAGILFREAESALGRHLWLLAVFNLIAGYGASLTLGYFVLQKKRVRKLVPELVFIPIYWLLISLACYRAVYQLIKAPHYWEKTEHGVSKFRRWTRKIPHP